MVPAPRLNSLPSSIAGTSPVGVTAPVAAGNDSEPDPDPYLRYQVPSFFHDVSFIEEFQFTVPLVGTRGCDFTYARADFWYTFQIQPMEFCSFASKVNARIMRTVQATLPPRLPMSNDDWVI